MTPLPQDFVDTALLERYLGRTCTSDEVGVVERWLAADPLWAAVIRQAQTDLGAGSSDEVDHVWADILHRSGIAAGEAAVRNGVHATESREGRQRSYRPDRFSESPERGARPSGHRELIGRQALQRILWPIAVAVVLAVIMIVVGWDAGVHHARAGSDVAMSTYVTGRGQRATITLPDGNTVALDVDSRLEVPADYVAGHHTVRLDGAAVFDITHHDATPFVVTAGAMSARVLGTDFVVRHYNTDTTIAVAVRDGKVAVGAAVLTAERQADMGSDGHVRVHPADMELFSFTNGVLFLNSMPLQRAIPELDRWYDADIRLGAATLGQQPIQGKLATGSISELATILEMTFHVRVVRDGRVLTLYPKP